MTKDRVIGTSAALVMLGAVLVVVQVSVFVCALVVGAGLSGLAWGNAMGKTDEVKRSNARVLAVIVTFVAVDAIVGSYLVGRPDGTGTLIFPGNGISLALRTRMRHGAFYGMYLYTNIGLFTVVALGGISGLMRFRWANVRGGVRRTDRYDVVSARRRY